MFPVDWLKALDREDDTGLFAEDLERFGFVPDDDGQHRFKFDTSLPGNRNTGHVFGDTLTETQRLDLLEYLKTF